ncbi:RidA family protein [Amycolatopsis cihanbeyliensis]|uniref:Enamine deaminase RidA (YjgF/YER057c/UK114 family) n=1 Tax=Amycolatopsis cihanbeyliensis TaxID=1128664 RepID=A0A542CUQ8_AMYCI|nr:Rid family hydrolase [Amycolatopsis cihanbeyliensis]TQI94557.1 enamine deaminase RidA (YjgF/YER057c/UK114 family) [Amycolatopsis cihanbeyliensis]
MTRHNPVDLHATSGYHHVTIVEGRRLVLLAGQCPLAADADPDSATAVTGRGDLDVQVDQVATNTSIALGAAGATPADVIRAVLYVASSDPAVLGTAWDRFLASTIGPAFHSAGTVVGVTCLGYPGQLVELDVTAAVED